MNPADVAQSALPIASSDVSLIALFLQAHWVVKAVMLGLLACSVWVWAIAIDKIFLYARTKRAMDRFEQAFWSGQSIEELYRALSAKPTQSMAACFVAAMREWKRSFESQSRSFAGLQMRIEKVMNVSIAREVERLERRLLVLATVGSACSARSGASCRASSRSRPRKIPPLPWWRRASRRRCLPPQSA
jgi:biopolymer transport protein TolQ